MFLADTLNIMRYFQLSEFTCPGAKGDTPEGGWWVHGDKYQVWVGWACTGDEANRGL